MPIYEYECSSCGERFEKFVRLMSAQPEVACPKCGSKQVTKTLSLFGVSSSSSTSTSSFAGSCAPTGG